MLSDHYKGGMTERLTVTIVTVDIPNGRIECVGKDAAVIQVAVTPIHTLFRWPKEGELWTIVRENGLWKLESLLGTQPAGSPGEAIIQTETLWTPSGDRFVKISVLDARPRIS